MKKRIISMILSIIMIISLLPSSAFAAEVDNLRNFTKRNTYANDTFDDVQKDDWFYENVKSVYEHGLMQGKGGKRFDTESGITIAETLTIAARLHSIYYTGSDEFTPSNPWYQVYADYCTDNGIASANSKTYAQPASRAEFAMILVNALPTEVFGEINKVADDAIPDVKISDACGTEVYKMYRAGIMIGNDDIGTFAPSSEIRRSEVAAIVTRMVDVSLREAVQLGNEYTVTFDINGHGKQIAIQTVVEGYTVEKPADPAETAYIFKGWYTQKSGGKQFDFNTPITEDITLYAHWELNSVWEDTSDKTFVENDPQITIEQGQMMVDLVEHIGQLTANGATRQDIRSYLEKINWIEIISNTPDGGLSCKTTFGIIATWTPHEDEKIASNVASTHSADLISKSIFDNLQKYDYTVKKIVILCPYASVDSDFMIDAYDSLATGLSEEINCDVTWLLDEDVSLEALKNLEIYDMVWFYSHGSLSNITNSAWDIFNSDPYTMTGEIADSAFKYVMLSKDWFSGRTIINLDTGRIGVGGVFYEYYYDKNELKDVFFHFASCNSMYSNELAKGILSRGAAWVEGWTNSVLFENDYAQFMHVIANLVNGDNIKDSIFKANEYVKNTYDFWQEDCTLKGLGNFYYHINSPMKSKKITLNFIDTATNSNLTCNKVNLEIISSDIHATSTVSLIHKIFTDGSASNYSTATIDLPYGAYVINFSANGYQDIVDIWTSPDDADFIVDESTTEFTIYMTPKVSPDPDTPDGFNITGTFVYLNDTNEEIPVSFAKCTLKDVTSNRNYYFAEVIDGRLSNEAFLTKPSSGTYLFELEGGDADDNGFYSRKVIENVVINSDFDFGKIYCDRVAYVSGTVVNENGEYLDNIGMTITQNGTTAMKIDNFDQGFYITLKEGLYTLTLTREGYSSYMTDFAVRGTTDLGTIELTPANSSSITMRIRFVDADSGEQLKISSIFDTTSYIGIGNSHLSDNSGFISGDFIDGSKGTNAFTVNNDSELIFINVPIFRDGYYYLGYYLSFDSSEKGYAIPDYYTIPALDITENYNGELEVDVKLDKVVLIVGDITVTEENAADILGDGTANFDSTNGVLTLINANITADYTVYTNMLELKIAIPSGTSSKLTITPVKYRGNTGGIQAAKYLSIYGGGTLTIDGQMGVNAINAGYYDDNYTVEISNITLNMPSSHTTGIMANTGNLILDGVTISKTGVEDYGHLIVGKDITIRNSTIDMSSNGSNLIWSSGGNISIADSNIDLVSELSTPAAFYSIFAEVGTIIVSGNTSISITTNKTDVTTDGEIFVATNGITLNNNLGVSDGNDECEIYNNEYQTSIRCVGSNTYPAKIIIQNN